MENKIHSAMKKAKYEKPKRVQVIALLEENLKKEPDVNEEINYKTITNVQDFKISKKFYKHLKKRTKI